MSQIPFVNLLGEAIEAAISHEEARSPRGIASGRGPGRRWRLPGVGVLLGHRRVSVVLVALVIGGGAVAVAETLQNSTALVTGGIVCYAGTGMGASVQMYANVEANGRSPEAACADVFRTDGPAALGRPGVNLIACADPHGYVAVFRATGVADQCQAEGMSALQARSYTVAQSSVDRLVRALNKIGASRTCMAPRLLAADVQHVLDRLGWSGWRAQLQRQPTGSGSSGASPRSAPTALHASSSCGLFLGTGSSFSDPTASLDAGHRVVWIAAGPIPSLLALTGPLDRELLQASGQHCYTPAGALSLVRKALASARVQVKSALTQEPAGGGWAYAQHAYDQGCTIVAAIAPAPYGRTVDAWLNSKSGPREPFGGGPSPSQFRSSLGSR